MSLTLLKKINAAPFVLLRPPDGLSGRREGKGMQTANAWALSHQVSPNGVQQISKGLRKAIGTCWF